MASKTRAVLTVKCLVSVGLLAWLFVRTEANELLATLVELDVTAFAAGVCFVALGVVLRSYKWLLLLRVDNKEIAFGSCMNVMFISMFFSNFFLGTLGGDAYRVYGASKFSTNLGSATSSVILERLLSFMSALILTTLTGILLLSRSDRLAPAGLLVAILLIGILCIFCLLAFFLGGIQIASLPVLRRLTRGRVFARDLAESTASYKGNMAVVAIALVLSLVFYVIQAMSIYMFGLAANASISVTHLGFITPLANILVALPISINGFGVTEGSFVFYLEQVGVSGPAALLIALSSRIGNLLMSLIGGLLFLYHFWRGRRAVRHTQRKLEFETSSDEFLLINASIDSELVSATHEKSLIE